MDYDWIGHFLVRAGRSTLLSNQMSLIEMAHRATSLGNRLTNANLVQTEAKRLRPWIPSDYLTYTMITSVPALERMTIHGELSLRLLAAELRGASWPIDPFDPAAAPLHRFERDGKLMGAYSVDENGVDDGGKKGMDRYFPLYGPLTPPAPATTTPAP